MKKVIMLIFVFMFLIMPVKTYADNATVEVKVNGEVKKGSIIEILVNVKDVEKFYAASVDFTYDTNQLKVESIVASEFITKHANDIMELGGEIDKNGNTASYSFTFLGEKNGIKGSGTLAKITAQVLNDNKLSIGQDTLKVKLVQRVGDTVENYSYKFIGYNNLGEVNTPSNGDNSQNNDSSIINNDSTENAQTGLVNNSSNNNNSNNTESNSASNIDNNSVSSLEVSNPNNNESVNKEDTHNENLSDKDTSKDNVENSVEGDSVEVSNDSISSVDKDSDKEVNKVVDEVKEQSLLVTENKRLTIGVVVAIVIVVAISGVGYYVYNKKIQKK